jgi:ACT domain-containing protein
MSEQQEITLTLTLTEVNAILSGLGELPAKSSMSVIQKIQQQAAPQIQQAPVPESE